MGPAPFCRYLRWGGGLEVGLDLGGSGPAVGLGMRMDLDLGLDLGPGLGPGLGLDLGLDGGWCPACLGPCVPLRRVFVSDGWALTQQILPSFNQHTHMLVAMVIVSMPSLTPEPTCCLSDELRHSAVVKVMFASSFPSDDR